MLTSADIPAHVRCCVIGDVHVGKVFTNAEGTLIVSPGPTAHTDLGGMLETPPSYAILEIEPSFPPAPDPVCRASIVPLPGRIANRVSYTGAGDASTLAVLDVWNSDKRALQSVIVVERAPGVERIDPAKYPNLILIDKPATALGMTEAGTLEEGADSIQDAVERYAPDPDDMLFRMFLLDLIEAGPKGARAAAEARLTELCGSGWAANT